ncbi:MAG: hypothetical protein LUC94_06955 [Clostridiales bacterium]|nr:hypothetical protein [Clostridiales bacterium]
MEKRQADHAEINLKILLLKKKNPLCFWIKSDKMEPDGGRRLERSDRGDAGVESNIQESE